MGRRRRGLRRGLGAEPDEGWPLDRLFVGVATVRTIREMLRWRGKRTLPRAWDLHNWSGVSPQGSADSMERLERVGLVTALPDPRAGHAPTFRLNEGYPLAIPLRELFMAEEYWYGRRGAARRRRSGLDAG